MYSLKYFAGMLALSACIAAYRAGACPVTSVLRLIAGFLREPSTVVAILIGTAAYAAVLCLLYPIAILEAERMQRWTRPISDPRANLARRSSYSH